MKYCRLTTHMIRYAALLLLLLLQLMSVCSAEEASNLPSALEIIGAEAFYGTAMEKVTIPEGTTEIQSGAFANSSLSEVMLPTSLTYLAEDAFDGTGPIAVFTYIEHEDSIEILRYTGSQTVVNVPAYINDKPVTSVKLGRGQSEPMGFTDVVKVTLPETIIRLDDYAFGGYLRLQSVEGLEYVQELGYDAFSGCAELQEAHFSTALREIDSFSFGNAYTLRRVTLPDDLTVPDENPFKLRAVEELTLLRGVNEATIKLVDGSIFSADGKTLISVLPMNQKNYYVIPDGTEIIINGAFAWAIFTDAIEIPPCVTSIRETEYYLDGRTVYVHEGSHAQTYFEENEMPSIPVFVIGADGEGGLQPLVDAIIAEVIREGMSDYDKALALHDWICENGSYDYSYKNTQAIHILTGGAGVCDAYARAYCILLDAVGIESRREECSVDGVGHAINAVRLDGEWCYVDCTNDDEGFGRPDLLFGFNDDIFSAYYSGIPSVKAPGIDHYAPLVDGRLDAALAVLSKQVQEALDAGMRSFTIIPEGEAQVEPIFAYALAAKLKALSWNVSGQSMEIDCSLDGSMNYACYIRNMVDWLYSQTEDGICLTKYIGLDTEVTVPAEIDGTTVVALERTFYGNESITSVVLPESITDIGVDAFGACTALQSVNIPSELKTIGSNAFWGCIALQTELVLPATLQSIGNGAFASCTSLYSVQICSGSAVLGKYIFTECSSLSRVSFAEGMTVLPDSTFYQCINLKTLTLPESLERIETSAFLMSGIVKLHLPRNVSYVSWDNFVEVASLTSLTVAEDNPHLTAYGNMLFTKDMSELLVSSCNIDADLVIPDGVQIIGAKAFKLNQTLTSVTMPDSVQRIGDEAFMGAIDLEQVDMGAGVETIGQYAFARGHTYSGMAANETYPAQTEGAYRFNSSGQTGMLKHVKLSSGLKAIGKYAFVGQIYLKQLILPESLTSIDGWIIDHAATLYVPQTMTYIAPQELMSPTDVLTICGIAGSYAETYAQEQGYPFINSSNTMTLNHTEVHLIPQESVTLEIVTINAQEAQIDPAAVIWTSSAPGIVSVDAGVLRTTGIGTAVITAEYQGMTAVCKVTSWDYKNAEQINWWDSQSGDTHTCLIGTEISMRLVYTLVSVDEYGNELIDPILPDFDDDTHAVYTVSDDSVLRVDVHGNITAVGMGTASVIATLPDGKVFTYEWTVI